MKLAHAIATFAGCAVAMVAAGVANAQTYNHVIGSQVNESANGIDATRDGGYVTAGQIIDSTSDQGDILVVKYRPDGSVQWASRFGGPGLDVGYSVQQTTDGGYVIGAETNSVGPLLNLAMLRLDPAGNYLWSWVHEGDQSSEDAIYGPGAGVSVRQFAEGFVLTGRKRVSETMQMGVLISAAPNGAPVFNFRYGDPRTNERTMVSFTDVRASTVNGFVVVGAEELPVTGTGTTNVDPILLRMTLAGVPIMARNYSLFPPDQRENGVADGVALADNGDIVFNGRTNFFGTGSTNMQSFRVDNMGVVRWVTVMPRTGSAYRSLHQNQRGEFAYGGWINTFPTASDAAMGTLDNLTGMEIWQRSYDYIAKAWGMVENQIDPGYGLCGSFNPPAGLGFGGVDIELINTNGFGRVGCLDDRTSPVTVRPPLEVSGWQPFQIAQAGTIWQGEFRRVDLRADRLCEPCPDCPADYNQDGGIDGSDVAAFFNAWSNGQPCADVNQDGGIDGSDVAAFFVVWQNGGC